MKRPLRRLAVPALALLLAAPAAAQKVTGQILGGPLDKVRIELTPLFQDYRQGVRRLQGEAEAPLAAASPRPDGTFEIAAPGPGFYLVTVRAAGHAPLQYPLAPLVDDTGLPPARLGPASPKSPWKPAAAPGADRKTTSRFAGLEVRDARGRPVPRALVRHGSGLPLGLTGPEGRLALPLAVEPELLVVETEDGRITSTTSPAGDAVPGRPWVVTLPTPEIVTGRVLAAGSRAPLPGALVWSNVTDPRTALAGPDGSVQLQVAPGMTEVFVQAAAPGHAPARFQVFRRPEDGGLEPVTLLLAPAAVLTGQVVDAEGRPVAGAAVQARPKGHPFWEEAGEDPAWSGPDGRFHLSRLIAGTTYELSARREGFAPGAAIANTATAGAAAAPLRIVLSRGRTVRGQVLDDARRPVAGAQVRLVSTDSGPYRPLTGHQALEVSADAQGGFELENVLAGRFDLVARAKGFVMALVPGVEVRDGAGPQDLGAVALPRGAALAGQVVDPRGAPVAGADVLYRRADNRYGHPRYWTDNLEENRATTDPEGRFRISGLPETQGFVLVRRAGYLPWMLGPVEVPAPEPLRIELRVAGALSGRVVGPRGEPVPDALLTGQGGVQNPAMGRTDGEGRFRLEDLPPGSVELMIQASGYRTRTWRGEAPEQGEAGPAEILLERGSTLRGRVTDADGTPVAGVRVRAELAADGLPSSAIAQTDGDGRYVLTGLGAGPHRVMAYGSEGRSAHGEKEIRPGTNSLDLAFEPGFEVSGWVRDEQGGPVAGAEIRSSSDSSVSTLSAGDGSFRIPGLREGSVELAVTKGGFVPLKHPLEVDGEPVRGIDLRLARGGAIAGRLLGATPNDLSGITVQARSNLSYAPGTVAPDGRYRIPDVAPGEWTVIASLSSGRRVRGTARLVPGEEEAVLDLDLSGDLSLSGRLALDGVPLTQANVLVQSQESGGFGGSAKPTADGRFRISRLPRGSYALVVLFIPAPSVEMVYERPVELTSDQEVSLEISTGSVQGRLLAPDGTPVTDTKVTLKGTAGEWSVLSEPSLDSQGRFHVPGLAAGTYQVHIRHDGTGEARLPFEVVPGETAQVDLVLEPPSDRPEGEPR